MWARLFVYVAGPMAVRVLAALGLGVVTYVGFDSALTFVFNEISAQFAAVPADMMGLLYMSGLPTGMAIILSALFARITVLQVSKIQRII